VPNLSSDRGLWVAGQFVAVDVRRLMYQSLIWAPIGTRVLSDDPRSLAAPLHTEDMECAANALVDRVRRDVELGRDFLG
jgi:cobalamin biosynthesis protein CobD/CbiB